MNVVLVMFRENGERRSFSLTRDVTVIGRREDADFRIPLSDVSRKHSRLVKDGNVLIVEDLGSANGTYHNGQRVQEAEVSPGDTIQVGPIQFVVQIDGVPTEEELMGDPHGMAGTSATHIAPAFAAGIPMPPPPIPPAQPAPASSADDELEVIEDDGVVHEVVESDEVLEELEEVDADDHLADFNILEESAGPDDDVIIDLGEPEETEKR